MAADGTFLLQVFVDKSQFQILKEEEECVIETYGSWAEER